MFLKCLGSCSFELTASSKKKYKTVIEELCHQYSLADIRISTNNFDETRVVGVGGFGKVYKGYLKHNDDSEYLVAIKRGKVTSMQQGRQEFKNEMELLCQLHHPNLISLIGFCNHKSERILVYEYMSNGSVYDHLLRRRGDMEALSWKKRLEISIGAARGLHYLHTGARHTILHRDLKPSNILLDHNMDPKLADFGLSIRGPHSMSLPKPLKVDHIAGTVGYIAMECFRGGNITDKSDVYSFGITLLEVASGMKYLKMLAENEPHNQIKPVEEIIDPDIKGNIAPQCWESFMDITLRCLELEPDERPSMGEVEVQIQHALLLQEQADIINTDDGGYTLYSTTIIDRGLPPESNTFSGSESLELSNYFDYSCRIVR